MKYLVKIILYLNIVIETGGGIFGVKAKHVTNTFVKVKDYCICQPKIRSNAH